MEAKPRITLIQVHECGWQREISDTQQWKDTVIDHPIYGTVTQLQAAYNDVNDHDCDEYRRARAHTPRAHERPVKYRRYKKS